MEKYEVVVLGVQGINNVVYGVGAQVIADNFPEGNAEALVKEGKLKRVVVEKKSEVKVEKKEKPKED